MQSSLLELENRARQGDPDAITQLVQLARRALEEVPQTVLELAPSIQTLSKTLLAENRKLQAEDMKLANRIVLELAENAALLPSLPIEVSALPKVMDRVLLYQDDQIEIRAHMFYLGASETFIHNHGQAFISTCIEGSYLHRIWAIDADSEGNFTKFKREPGGLYATLGEGSGNLENVLCQPFKQGQSLFISALANHSVEGQEKTSTIVIRDKGKRFKFATILSRTSNIEAPTDEPQECENEEEKHRIKSSLKDVLTVFRNSLITEPVPPYFSETTTLVRDVLTVAQIGILTDVIVLYSLVQNWVIFGVAEQRLEERYQRKVELIMRRQNVEPPSNLYENAISFSNWIFTPCLLPQLFVDIFSHLWWVCGGYSQQQGKYSDLVERQLLSLEVYGVHYPAFNHQQPSPKAAIWVSNFSSNILDH